MLVIAEPTVIDPFPWAALLGYLDARLIPGAERIVDDGYERRHNGATVRVTYHAGGKCLRITADDAVCGDEITVRVIRLFDTGQDTRAVDRQLRACPLLRPRVDRMPGLRPLGCWCPFELCVRTVVGQQVSVAAAATLMRRLAERCGELSPAALCAADLDAIGMPGRRVATLRRLAEAVATGELALEHADWAAIDAGLSRLPGIGPWTRAYLAIRLGRQPDILPETDLGLLRAAGAASPTVLRALSQRWRPYRAHAATYLWCAV
ncbi:DNA-3-methyladenine glycosylase family protein [Nitrococcus mobilis]|uniref:DNA-3-methyladenine glycosylase II n=1 Tax=Nitrococcus mobilis Nb-231 TaxID=314278 RepID=A4BNP3_9GAMM|nr:AlkA N-terminal domain-containing protein [Nitrococcus mobilis]EAR22842.1 3-methyladenine DNA glycosylase/8- oxoguanineDNA glycosylase [Nitrococcus mobilis Nb-231]